MENMWGVWSGNSLPHTFVGTTNNVSLNSEESARLTLAVDLSRDCHVAVNFISSAKTSRPTFFFFWAEVPIVTTVERPQYTTAGIATLSQLLTHTHTPNRREHQRQRHWPKQTRPHKPATKTSLARPQHMPLGSDAHAASPSYALANPMHEIILPVPALVEPIKSSIQRFITWLAIWHLVFQLSITYSGWTEVFVFFPSCMVRLWQFPLFLSVLALHSGKASGRVGQTSAAHNSVLSDCRVCVHGTVSRLRLQAPLEWRPHGTVAGGPHGHPCGKDSSSSTVHQFVTFTYS